MLTKAKEQRVNGDGVDVEERGRYYPSAGGDDDHWQPSVIEHGRFVDERELFDRLQRLIKFEVKRRYGGARYDDFADEQYEVCHLHTYIYTINHSVSVVSL